MTTSIIEHVNIGQMKLGQHKHNSQHNTKFSHNISDQ